MKKYTTNKFFRIGAIAAFASVISFFHINSYVADKNHLNGLFIGVGIVAGLVAIGCYLKLRAK